ncbi:MAG: YesL family protein [Clostridiales Family XIII bacterium]|jgi:uncharacterized membrane protein YesL|nr:YesL family protein [Clostridiales Family XIII bacterium]
MKAVFKFVDYEKVREEGAPKTGARLFLQLFLDNVWDLFFLNLIVALCAVPVVTLGPALAAANRVAFNMVRGECAYATKEFFRYFKISFLQGLGSGLLMAGVGVALVTFVRSCFIGLERSAFLWIPIGLSIAVAAMIALSLLYVFTLCGTSTLNPMQIVKNSLILGITQLRANLIPLSACLAVFIPEALFLPKSLPVLVLFGIMPQIFITNFFVYKPILRYVLTKGSE